MSNLSKSATYEDPPPSYEEVDKAIQHKTRPSRRLEVSSKLRLRGGLSRGVATVTHIEYAGRGDHSELPDTYVDDCRAFEEKERLKIKHGGKEFEGVVVPTMTENDVNVLIRQELEKGFGRRNPEFSITRMQNVMVFRYRLTSHHGKNTAASKPYTSLTDDSRFSSSTREKITCARGQCVLSQTASQLTSIRPEDLANSDIRQKSKDLLQLHRTKLCNIRKQEQVVDVVPVKIVDVVYSGITLRFFSIGLDNQTLVFKKCSQRASHQGVVHDASSSASSRVHKPHI